MKYIINRTSGEELEGVPFQEVWYNDYRGFKNIEELYHSDKKLVKEWLENGRNHRNIVPPFSAEENAPFKAGGVVREILRRCQVIEIDDLESWLKDLTEDILIHVPDKVHPQYTEPWFCISIIDSCLG